MEWAFSQTQLLLITWVLFAFAAACVGARLIIRYRICNRLLIDDYFAITSLTCLLGQAILCTVAAPTFTKVQNVTYYGHKPPKDFKHDIALFQRYQWGTAYTFFTGIWAVKFVFISYYGKLTDGVRPHRAVWYALIVYAALAYIACLVAYPLLNYRHGASGVLKSQSIKVNFSMDVTTDVFIAALPLSLAFRINVPLKRKLALSAIFSLGLVVTIFAIIRFTLCYPSGKPYGAMWLLGWSAIEFSVAVMISSTISLRNLVISRRDRKSSDVYAKSGKASGGRTGESSRSAGVGRSRKIGRERERSDGDSEMDIELLDRPVDALDIRESNIT
ncbi:MAG: hypothetical protein M1820_002745 [Bogoriella megaspora]|nr:MAG: hypothetical protein M1820_002745 [Bogoriella megaspora]